MTTIRKKSQKQENRVAKDIAGKVTIASGALYTQKADVRNEEFLIECKTTAKSFYSLKEDIWDKIRREALRDSNRHPLMQIQVNDGKQEFVVMSHNSFLCLELDQFTYYGKGEPDLIEAKSFRITDDMLDFDFPDDPYQDMDVLIPRCDVKFVGRPINKHLVIMYWDDFLNLIELARRV